jgi:NADP-dependent 3-hydroxy acid dehydrogenase YdfG
MLMKNLREEEWAHTVEINCKGALNCVGAVLPGMLGRGRGPIVIISSDAGRKVFPGLAVYSGSTFFVEALSQGLRLETAGTGLKVSTVQPGNVATDLLSLSCDEEALEIYRGQRDADAGSRRRCRVGRLRALSTRVRCRQRGSGRAP